MKLLLCTLLMLSISMLTSHLRNIADDPKLIFTAASVFVFYMVILLFRKISVCFLKSKAVYSPDKILNKRKPFYTNKTTWDRIRMLAFMQRKEFNEFAGYVSGFRMNNTSSDHIDYFRGD